ncbi:MAG TPA: MG2 domain-containing protein [Myxococcales bacterium]|nr:MG2 domain-containing protein [Myxococcales bacterium]
MALVLVPLSTLAASTPTATIARPTPQRPADAKGTVLVPDRFLRRWDPVTIFFAKGRGPVKGGPEDHPERLLSVTPLHPGAFTWLDARTLQFRPAEPWPPLARFTWVVDDTTFGLTTLMAAPKSTIPSDNAVGLDTLDAITLTFAEPIDPQALARMVTLELRPLPGIGAGSGRWMTRDDFEIKTMERRARNDAATYVVELKSPIPLGTRAVVHLRLSLDDDAKESFAEIAFATAEPFRILEVGCRTTTGTGSTPVRRTFPVTPEGSRYSADQALNCGSGTRTLLVEFSAQPRELGPVEARNLVRFTPSVDKLTYAVEGNTLTISGEFGWDKVYRVNLTPTKLSDQQGRPLDVTAESEVYVYFPRRPGFLQWGAAQGVMERLGPQMLPVTGRGKERLDLRVFPIDPLDRSFWPFPGNPVVVDEAQQPPPPGEEPPPYTALAPIPVGDLQTQITALGSPLVSAIVPLPLKREGGAATFGLDVKSPLTRINGTDAPGTYLVGFRRLDSSSERSWMRVQVTDLSLTAVEEPLAVHFAVTSLSTSKPIVGASIELQGVLNNAWVTLAEGTTGGDGHFIWPVPGHDPHLFREMRRIVVTYGNDRLVLDADRPPDGYSDNHWSPTHERWLQWAFEPLAGRGPQPEDLCHIFTERPVYRPEEEVHIKGYLRRRERGTLAPRHLDGFVVIQGPGDQTWKRPVTTTEAGSFYTKFAEANLPTGEYKAHFEDRNEKHYGEVAFRMEAYRIPAFEVQLHAPDKVPLDREFEVKMSASYYAGGKVNGRPLQWRVTQFPYTWTPKQREGFRYSSDGRFSGTGRFESSPKIEKADTTDDDGGASLVVNPAIEPTAQPRTYTIEATVTGADDQTVTNTKHVIALPPFVLGLKVPRYLEKAQKIEPELIVVGPDGELQEGTEVTVRLLNRQWHSHLRASDFSDGVARYVTDVVDEKVSEQTVVSGTEPVKVTLPIDTAGVYIVELSAHDKLNRAQVVAVDLYAGGEQPVTWAKPTTRVFEVASDKEKYDPDDTANLVLKSPYQDGRVLVIVEAPEGIRYEWLDVKGGSATYTVPLKNTYVPQLPVHFILMRPRVRGTGSGPADQTDLGKPSTVAATAWVKVNPVDNRVNVALANPEKARPGEKVDVTIQLSDPKGKPLPGEVTLWLVDQAVLALGKEQRLDPLPDFITEVKSHLITRDTRNLPFGYLPFAENPGGSGGEGEEAKPFEKITVRRSFKPVPYYNPAIMVGPDGVATVTVELPDNLTNFKLRAKAISGPDRFGFATGDLAVRLPVIVQPALPRFVRPNDRFTGAAIGRIVEGEGGPGSAGIWIDGATLSGERTRELSWVPERPERIAFDVDVGQPPYTAEGVLGRDDVTFKVAVKRESDGVGDAFEVKLPIRDDRQRVVARALQDLQPLTPMVLPAISEPARPGTIRRSVLISDQPAMVRMAGGLDFLLHYPYGCTEQKLSRARSYVALKKFRELLHEAGAEAKTEKAVKDFLDWLPLVVDANGLCAYWPGGRGYVSLTAWAVDFLVEARAQGFAVDQKLFDTLTTSLDQALRSDYSHFIDGEAFVERAWALSALANAGKFNPSYAAELARRAQFLDIEGVAQVSLALERSGDVGSSTLEDLNKKMWDGVVIRLYQSHELYGGLQKALTARNGLILPSESRTVAEMTRAVSRLKGDAPRLQVLINALVTLGRGDGWGSTNANAAALLGLSEILTPPFAGSKPHSVLVRFGTQQQALDIGPDAPLAHFIGTSAEAGDVSLQAAPDAAPVVARAETAYVPAADGSQVAAAAEGFVVTREMLRVPKADDVPLERVALTDPGTTVTFTIGEVVEEHAQVVNPEERHYVAVVVPLAAGLEPLNAQLATASADAKPRGTLTLEPSYVGFLDDGVSFYYDTLPKGTFDFYFRSRATTAGHFIQPAARAEMMYDGSVHGNSAGARVEVTR